MKLPNFRFDAEFERLRDRMKAPYVEWQPTTAWEALKLDIGDLLRTQHGIELDEDLAGLDQNPDGTFAFEGHRVLLYIRDQYHAPGREYKFHLARCSTISKMFSSGRKNRYVVTTNTTGDFFVRLLSQSGDLIREGPEALRVCKNCLSHLNYKQYNESWRRRNEVYRSFSIDEYFSLFGGTHFSDVPDFDEYNAPTNQYPENWPAISEAYRRSVQWTCERCGLDLSANPQWLHVHHLNHQRYDCRTENLLALCIGCHAEEPDHQRLRSTPDYADFADFYARR